MEQFDKPAHMGALVVMRQIHVHINGGNCMLKAVASVSNSDWIPQVFNSNFIDWDLAIIRLALNVFHGNVCNLNDSGSNQVLF